MTAEAVFAERAARRSAARLRQYEMLIDELSKALPEADFDRVRAIRNNLTHRVPWMSALPVWGALYAALATNGSTRKKLERDLHDTSSALQSILTKKRHVKVPDSVLGDVSADVQAYFASR